ncbi:integrase, catalytic region, zinc finger, CCHC-type containing protein [Tanacetum coccineum]
MTTPIKTNGTDSQMHNNIMAAGSRDRPPMLAPGRYAQWRSRFMRYIDTKDNGEALKKCITKVIEDLSNMSTENKAHYKAKKEAIHMLLTGIGDEIYSTVDACKTAHEMWIAIKRLQQVNVQFLQQLQPEWSRFVTLVKQKEESDTMSYHKLFDILKQYQKEVNEICAEKIARNANPLALVAVAQQYPDPYYQAPKPQRSYAPAPKQYSSTRSNVSTKHKGKEIAKPITPPSESASEEDSDPEQAQKDKEMQKNLALIAKETVGNQVVQQTGIQCYNCKVFGHFAKECRKPKRTKDYTYHKEKMLMCKLAEKGVPLQAEQADWLEDTDEEIDEQELEAHYSFMAKIQEVLPADSGSDVEPLEKVQYDAEYNVFANKRQHYEQPHIIEKDNSNGIPDSSNMCDNDNQADQNAEECDDEHAALANLITNLTLNTEENKKILKQLKKANASLAQELKE